MEPPCLGRLDGLLMLLLHSRQGLVDNCAGHSQSQREQKLLAGFRAFLWTRHGGPESL